MKKLGVAELRRRTNVLLLETDHAAYMSNFHEATTSYPTGSYDVVFDLISEPNYGSRRYDHACIPITPHGEPTVWNYNCAAEKDDTHRDARL